MEEHLKISIQSFPEQSSHFPSLPSYLRGRDKFWPRIYLLFPTLHDLDCRYIYLLASSKPSCYVARIDLCRDYFRKSQR